MLLLLKRFYQFYLKNEKIVSDDEEIVFLNDVEVIDGDNDPEKVTKVKADPKMNQTSDGDKVVGEGKDILKSEPGSKEKGQRSWLQL